MTLILGLDFETTGFDPLKDKIIEIGAVLWDTKYNQPVRELSCLINHGDVKELNQEIIEVTHITKGMLEEHGTSLYNALIDLSDLYHEADLIVAHNAPFDRSFLLAGSQATEVQFAAKLWLDTTVDIEFPRHIKHRNLTYLSAVHGFVNPFAHRALSDVHTMLKILMDYDLDKVISSAKQKRYKLRAVVSFDQKNLAKQAGFHWDGDAKIWHKTIKEENLSEEMKREFKTIIIEEIIPYGL